MNTSPWTMENYFNDVTTITDKHDTVYHAPLSTNNNYNHKRQLPSFHKVLNHQININNNNSLIDYHNNDINQFWDTNSSPQPSATNATMVPSSSPMRVKPEFDSIQNGKERFFELNNYPDEYEQQQQQQQQQQRFVLNRHVLKPLVENQNDDDYYQSTSAEIINGIHDNRLPIEKHHSFRQRTSLNNVDYFNPNNQHLQLNNNNSNNNTNNYQKPLMSRRHSSATSLLDVPFNNHHHHNNGIGFIRDCSPHRRASYFPQQSPHLLSSTISSTMINPNNNNNAVIGTTTNAIDFDVDQQDLRRRSIPATIISEAGSTNNLNPTSVQTRHSPLNQQHSSMIVVTTASTSATPPLFSMAVSPFGVGSQAENGTFHHSNHPHNHLHHQQQQQQQHLQFSSHHQHHQHPHHHEIMIDPSASTIYSSSTSSLQTSSSSSQNNTGAVVVSSSPSVVLPPHSPRKLSTNSSNGYGGAESPNIINDDNLADEEFHIHVNKPVEVNERCNSVTKTNEMSTNNDHNHLHVPSPYCDVQRNVVDIDSIENDNGEDEDDNLDENDLFQNHRTVRRHRSLPAPTFMSNSSSMSSMKPQPRSSSFRIKNNHNRPQSATKIQEPNGYWRIRVKKTRPYLGIAIEGGSNVSAQSQPRIINIQDGGAANVDGLHVGHIIMEVDGQTTNFMNHEQVAQMIARAYYNTPEKDYVEFLVREKSRNEFDLRRSSFMLLNNSFE